MAEFIDVVHTIQRICKRADGRCPACLLGEFACPNNVRFDKTDEAAFRELEDVVTKWAEENQEPVYPRWVDWLCEHGLVGSRPALRTDEIEFCLSSKVFTPIDADTAEKLGIEPKEAT